MLGLQVPIIPDIHQRIYKLARPKKALYMGDWHKCGTTHCRGGWVTHAAGAAGADLELAVGPAVAAYLIYAKSSRIAVSGRAFYVNEKSALASMKRMAKLEAQNGKA